MRASPISRGAASRILSSLFTRTADSRPSFSLPVTGYFASMLNRCLRATAEVCPGVPSWLPASGEALALTGRLSSLCFLRSSK